MNKTIKISNSQKYISIIKRNLNLDSRVYLNDNGIYQSKNLHIKKIKTSYTLYFFHISFHCLSEFLPVTFARLDLSFNCYLDFVDTDSPIQKPVNLSEHFPIPIHTYHLQKYIKK